MQEPATRVTGARAPLPAVGGEGTNERTTAAAVSVSTDNPTQLTDYFTANPALEDQLLKTRSPVSVPLGSSCGHGEDM